MCRLHRLARNCRVWANKLLLLNANQLKNIQYWADNFVVKTFANKFVHVHFSRVLRRKPLCLLKYTYIHISSASSRRFALLHLLLCTFDPYCVECKRRALLTPPPAALHTHIYRLASRAIAWIQILLLLLLLVYIRCDKMHSPVTKVTGFIALMIVQIILLALFWLFVRYSDGALPSDEGRGLGEEHVSKYPREYLGRVYLYFYRFISTGILYIMYIRVSVKVIFLVSCCKWVSEKEWLGVLCCIMLGVKAALASIWMYFVALLQVSHFR